WRPGWAQSCGRGGHFASGRRTKQQTNNKTTSKADPLRQRPKRWSSPYPCLSIEPLPGVNSRTSRQRCASDFSENKISRWLRLDKTKISRLAGFCFAESKISRSVRILHKWRRSSDTGAVRLGYTYAPATLLVSSRAFSIQQTRGRQGDQVWSQWSQAPRRGRCGPPRMR